MEDGINSTYQVRCNNGIQAFRLQHHPTRHGVDEHLLDGDISEFLGDLGGDFVPEHHAVSLGVALGHDGEMLARTLLGNLEREADDALDGVAGEDRHFRRRLPCLASV
jgi:hypothetical protein